MYFPCPVQLFIKIYLSNFPTNPSPNKQYPSHGKEKIKTPHSDHHPPNI